MTGIPIITLELDRMRHTISTALLEHNGEISAIVENALKEICTPEYLTNRIHELSKPIIEECLNSEVEHYYKYGAGRTIIQNLVYTYLNNTESI